MGKLKVAQLTITIRIYRLEAKEEHNILKFDAIDSELDPPPGYYLKGKMRGGR